MLDRLVGGTVLSQGNAVVGEHVNHMQSHQGGEAHWRSHVIRKDQECGPKGNCASMCCQSIEDRPHRVFADAEVKVISRIRPATSDRALKVIQLLIRTFKVAFPFQGGVRGWIEVCRTAEERREFGRDRTHHFARSHPGGDTLRIRRELREIRIPAFWQLSQHRLVQLLCQFRIHL